MSNKGWSCAKCGCLHNYQARSNCRWCGARCPSMSVKRQFGNWFGKGSWYGYTGGYRHNQTNNTGENLEESVATDGSKPDQQKLAKLKRDIKQLTDMGNCEESLATKRRALQDLEQKIFESKPRSQILQKLESQVNGAEKRLTESRKVVANKKELVAQAQRALEEAEAKEAKASQELDEYQAQLSTHSKEVDKDENMDKDIQAPSPPGDPLLHEAGLIQFFGGELPLELRGLRAAITNRQQHRAQQEQDREAAKTLQNEQREREALGKFDVPHDPQGTRQQTKRGAPRGAGSRGKDHVESTPASATDSGTRRKSRSRSPHIEDLEGAARSGKTELAKEIKTWMASKPEEGAPQKEVDDWNSRDPAKEFLPDL